VNAYGGMELGGTKVVCAVGRGPGEIVERTVFPTTTPDETLDRATRFLAAHRPLAAVGIAAFGPLDLDPASAGYGSVTTTPKRDWPGTRVRERIEAALGVPAPIDTDVSAAALAEWRWGAARGVDTAAYVTVGTGIGAGILVAGRPYRGLSHPEFGHVPVARDPSDDFPGVCPFHGDCLEGLASGPAIEARWHTDPPRLPADHEGWALEAGYLGSALATLVLILAPGRIVLGGGVMTASGLIALVRARVRQRLAGYLAVEPLDGLLDDYLVPPALGADAGVLGAIALARQIVDSD
jgi:fructokinase